MVDTEIAWPLMFAWQARDALGLDQATADLIADRIISTVKGKFWQWPTLRLNQINWYTRMYVAAATVGGDRQDLQTQLLEQVRRFVDGARKPMTGATTSNLGGGYRFHYLPQALEHHKYNLDSAEYANIVFGFLVAYKQARDAGMPALDSGRADVVRAWSERVLTGYWTHAGYLNWDTGLGFKRWHQGKKLGLSQAALLGIAVCPELAPNQRGPSTCSTAASSSSTAGSSATAASHPPTRSRCRRSTTTRARRCSPRRACRPTPPRPRFRAREDGERGAAAAVRLRPRRRPARDHHAHLQHADRRGLAQRVPVRRVDIARLFDGQQDVAGGVGGRPPASFGVVVRSGGKIVAASQHAVDERPRPARAARGAARDRAQPEPYPRHPYAGAFKTLRVRGTARANGISIQTTHRFEATFIETQWRVSGASGKAVEALFPSWGASAKVSAVNAAGERRAVAAAGSRSPTSPGFTSRASGPATSSWSTAARARPRSAPSAQSSAPKPGPTLTIRARGTKVTARIAPARTVDEARAIAARLVG